MSFYFTLPHPSPPQDMVSAYWRTACPWEHERYWHPNPNPHPILDEVITAIPDITAYVLETVGADIRSDKVTLVEGAEDSFFVGLGDAVGWAETVLRCSAAFPG